MSQIINITDLNIPELNIYNTASEVQLLHINEPKPGIFIAESPIVIERALDAGYTPISMLIEDKQIEKEAAPIIERCNGTPIYTASFDILTKLTGYKLTRGMLCAMQRRSLPTATELCKEKRRIAVLENVMNPTNIGAIFRSAAALNIDAVLLTSGCSDPLYRRAIRVSMGTVFQIPWTYINSDITVATNHATTEIASTTNLSWIAQFKKLGFKLAAMALTDDSVSIDDKQLLSEERLAIILGTEGEGLEKQTIESCDYTVKIPMSHGVDSLNVAAASAVAFWQLCK